MLILFLFLGERFSGTYMAGRHVSCWSVGAVKVHLLSQQHDSSTHLPVSPSSYGAYPSVQLRAKMAGVYSTSRQKSQPQSSMDKNMSGVRNKWFTLTQPETARCAGRRTSGAGSKETSGDGCHVPFDGCLLARAPVALHADCGALWAEGCRAAANNGRESCHSEMP